MKPKKEKTFFDKINELKGKPGKIELSDKDRNNFVQGADDSIVKESDKMEQFIWLITGIGIGILGNFIVALFYDWLKSLETWQFISLSIGIIFLFLMVCYILVDKVLEHRRNIRSMINMRKMWRRAKSVDVGPAMKAYEADELDELKKDLAKMKNEKLRYTK